MRRYAHGTAVSPEKSRTEVEALFRKHGATRVATDMDVDRGVVVAKIGDRYYRFHVARPTIEDIYAQRKADGKERPTLADVGRLREKEWSRRWRVLVLVMKAKLEMVASGDRSIEQEFLADIVLPGGKTFAEWALPELADASKTGAWEPPRLGSGDL